MVQCPRNCCPQCSCVYRNSPEQKTIASNKKEKSDFFKCKDTSFPCEQCVGGKIFLVCCKECVINAPPGDFPQVRTLPDSKLGCNCKNGSACAVCLKKRLRGKTLVGSKEDARKEPYDKFDSDRLSYPADYSSKRRSNNYRHHREYDDFREDGNRGRERKSHQEKTERPGSMYSPSENGRAEQDSGKYSHGYKDKRYSEAKGKNHLKNGHERQRGRAERSRKARSVSSVPESSIRRSSYSPPRNRKSPSKTYADSRQGHGDSIKGSSDCDCSSRGHGRESVQREDHPDRNDARSSHSKTQGPCCPCDVESVASEESKGISEQQSEAVTRNATGRMRKESTLPGRQTAKEIYPRPDSTVVGKRQEAANLFIGGKRKTLRTIINTGGLDKFKDLGRTVNASDLNRIRLETKDLFRMEMDDKKRQNKTRF